MISVSKNHSDVKKNQKSVVVSSIECDKCLDKCDKYTEYSKSIVGKFGKGIKCWKLKGL